MHPSCQRLFEQLESRKEEILRSFRSMSVEQFNLRPRDNKWSAAEVLSHLVTAERLSVAYMHKKAPAITTLERTGLWEEIILGILIVSQRMPGLKFKAPKRVVENTTVLMTLPEIEAAWKVIRDDLRTLLETLPREEWNRKIYRHPIAGYMNLKQALIFLREHLIHHGPQLRALVK
jgi:uncharacterized damage-inducible protein DinB